ncbi:VLRF1 family aeRF1-type release factor [Virgibacillus halodenitrificans]
MAPGATNAQKDNFAARYEANKQRWYKKIAPKLDKAAKDKEWEKIVIVGESDPSQELKQQMNKQVDEVIQKNMLDHEESKVLAEVFG